MQSFNAALCRAFGLILMCRASDMSGNCDTILKSPNGHEALWIALRGSPDGVCDVLFHVFYMS